MINRIIEKKHNVVILQYYKVQNTINSCKTIAQLKSAERMVENLANWWVSFRPMSKPFEFIDDLEPNARIKELTSLCSRKYKEIIDKKGENDNIF